MKPGELKRAIYKYLDGLSEPQTISGWAFSDTISRITEHHVYPTVALKTAKWWALLSHGGFDCIDRRRSLYKFTPGKRKVHGTDLEKGDVLSGVKAYRNYRGLSAKE